MKTPMFRYDVFLSYNHADRDWVRNLAKRLLRRKLREAKFRVFFDEFAIKAGESIPAAVRRGLRESERIVLVMTPEWVVSEWDQLETDVAVMGDPSARRRRIIPILLRDCEVPQDVARLKHIDFRDPSSFDVRLEQLVGELRGTPFGARLQNMVGRQRQTVLNLPILPWTPEGSPSLDFIWPELFVEPRLRPHKHPGSGVRLDVWLSDYSWNSNIAIVGSPGIGKSMTLRAIFLRLTDPEELLRGETFPILTSASELLEWEQSSDRSLIAYLGRKAGVRLSKSFLPRQRTLILVDGLDEVEESKCLCALDHLVQETPRGTVVWVGSRGDFFFRNIATKVEWSAFFYEILELLEWDEVTDSLAFASNYANRLQQPCVYDRLLSLKREFPEIVPFLKNPFELSLVLYLLSDDQQLQRENISNSYALYRTFYENWMVREHHRGTAQQSPHTICRIHRRIASELFPRKGLGIDLGPVARAIVPKIRLADLMADTSFSGLLITRTVPRTSKVTVLRFWHETIHEFLLAEMVVAASRKGGASLLDALQTVYNYEVNIFVRGAFQWMNGEEREAILRNMEALYVSLFADAQEVRDQVERAIRQGIRGRTIEQGLVSQSDSPVRIREQILYYVGRLPLPFLPEVLRFGYYNEPSSLLRRIAALGATLHNDESIEMDYLGKLTPDSPEDRENRSVQLVYFGDVDGDIHSYRDDGRRPWARTRDAIYRRLGLGGQREMRLRWWDLRTLYLFYGSRGWSDLITTDQFNTLVQAPIISSEFSEAKLRALSEERQKLVAKLVPLIAVSEQ